MSAAGELPIHEGARFRVREGIVLSASGGQRFLTDLDTGSVFELNETAVTLFEGARDGRSVGELAAALQSAFPDVPMDEIGRDTREALASFVQAGILLPA